jgi:hypothetical protein
MTKESGFRLAYHAVRATHRPSVRALPARPDKSIELRGRLWKAKAVFTLFNKVRRLCSQLLGLATVIVAHFSQGLFRSAAAHQVGLRMEHFGDF